MDLKAGQAITDIMIDKLNKWIYRQNSVSNLFSKNYITLEIPILPDPPELPPLPELPVFITQKEIDRKINDAIKNEREACAKACEDAEGYFPNDIGGGFAKLIRERSDD